MIVDARDVAPYYPSGYSREKGGGMETAPQYVISGTYGEFLQWLREDPKVRAHVTYLGSVERAQLLVEWGAPKGVLHRIGTWERSPAREAAEQLEGGHA